MKAPLRVLLLVGAFALELWVLTTCAVAAYRWPNHVVLRLSATVMALLVMGVLWGLFAAPRARARVTGLGSVAFKLSWFGAGVLATWWVLGSMAGLVLAAVTLIDACGLRILDRASGKA